MHTHDKTLKPLKSSCKTLLSKENKLSLNYNKATGMTIGTKERINDSRKLNLQVDEVCIQDMSTQKLLGFHLDQYLTWTARIDNLC